jgi:putative membrane protein
VADDGSDEGQPDPPFDPRFTLANERTLLAWSRTSLAFIASGLAIIQFFDHFVMPGGRRLIGVPLILLGGMVAAVSGRQWHEREEAMRAGRPIPKSSLGQVVSIGIVLISVVAGFVAATGLASN